MYFVELFLRCRHLVQKMRNLLLQSQCFNKILSTNSKKEDTIYMRIICLSYQETYFVKMFTPCRCLCGVMNFLVD